MKSENKLLTNIEKTYGKDAELIIGDWNDTGRVHFMSTPGIGLKRKLAERFTVYSID